MRVLALALLAACGGGTQGGPPKRPNNELIIGEFERRPPDGTTAFRFRADGSITVAHDRSQLDGKTLATGTWKLDTDQLTLVYTGGDMCKPGEEGVYKVVISKLGIHFQKVSESCDTRAKLDGQVLKRFK
jgi:hypothetical protein